MPDRPVYGLARIVSDSATRGIANGRIAAGECATIPQRRSSSQSGRELARDLARQLFSVFFRTPVRVLRAGGSRT